MRLKVNESIEDTFEKKCPECNQLLSDDGHCPYCEHGEEDVPKNESVVKEAYDDSLYVDIDEVVGTLGRALEDGMGDPDVYAEVADIYGRLVEMRDAGYQLVK